jgi:heme exporter protein CcmB
MNKTRVLHVRVVGFSAPERQMLNSIFLLSVAPARQIGYKLWNPEAGVAPDMYLLDGDSDSAVASWQATFASTSDRTLVVGAKNLDLGVASASRPLGLKVVGAMDRLAIALGNLVREAAGHDASSPGAGNTMPPPESTASVPKQEQTLARVTRHADGTLEQIALSPYPLAALVFGKIVAHWLTTGLPIAVLAPVLGLQYAMDGEALFVLAAALAIGTPILSLLGAIGAALTLGLRAGGSLLALLVLPLYVPVLIFGAGAVDAARAGLGVDANFSLLGAGLLVAIVGAPLAAAAAVRIALD